MSRANLSGVEINRAATQGIRREGDTQFVNGIDRATPKAILILEDVMPTLVGFGRFAALLEEQMKRSAAAFSPATKG